MRHSPDDNAALALTHVEYPWPAPRAWGLQFNPTTVGGWHRLDKMWSLMIEMAYAMNEAYDMGHGRGVNKGAAAMSEQYRLMHGG